MTTNWDSKQYSNSQFFTDIYKRTWFSWFCWCLLYRATLKRCPHQWKSQDVDRTTLSALSRKCVNVHLALPPWSWKSTRNDQWPVSTRRIGRVKRPCAEAIIAIWSIWQLGQAKFFRQSSFWFSSAQDMGIWIVLLAKAWCLSCLNSMNFNAAFCLHVSALKLDEFDVLTWFRPSLLAVCLWVATTCVKKGPKVDGDFEYSYHVLSPVETISTIEERWIPIKRSYGFTLP